MINKLDIQNFQIHKQAHLDFDQGVNVITGSSDVGKSSIIRALRWCLFNTPGGFEFKNWGAATTDFTKSIITFDNDIVLARERNSTTNRYVLNGEELQAIGRGVPRVVEEVTQMPFHNVQSQHDGQFLIQNNSGDVAKAFNTLVGMDKIDDVMRKVNKVKRAAAAEKRSLDKRVDEKQDKLDSYPDVVTIREKYNEANTKTREFELVRNELNGIVVTLFKLNRVQTEKDMLPNVDEAMSLVDEITRHLNDIRELTNESNKLRSLYQTLGEVTAVLSGVKEKYESSVEKVADLLDKAMELDAIKRMHHDIIMVIQTIQVTRDQITRETRRLELAVENYEDFLDVAGICPMCGADKEHHNTERVL